MKRPRNYAVYEDGHEEDLLYFEANKSGGSIFATESGIYRIWPDENRVTGVKFGKYPSHFDRLGPVSSDRTDEIKYVTIDERIPYEYRICGDGACVCGSVLVPPDATDQDIRKLIMEDLDIQYRKE